jgi:hypothetical protein
MNALLQPCAGIYDRRVEQGYGGSFGSGKLNVAQHLNVDPDLKLVTERSPYMRSER